MEGGAEALEEPRPGRDTLMLRRSDCNREEVPVAVDGRCNEGDDVLRHEESSVDAEHLQRMDKRRRAHPQAQE